MENTSKGPSLVSIVIPCYNHEDYIQDSIMSVVNQCYENIELIVIDDGSKDASVEKIKELIHICKGRFKRFEFRARENIGLCATLNEAIDWCQGEYYAAIASDDILKPGKTALQVEYLDQHPSCVAVFGSVETISGDGTLLRSSVHSPRKYEFDDIFFHRHSLPAPTQMIRLKSLVETGGYPEGLAIEDWYMWLKLSISGATLDNLGVVVTAYRRHTGNMSGQIGKMEKGRYAILEMFKLSPGYRRAYANAVLMAAIDWQLYDKKSSLYKLMLAIRTYPAVVFQLKFIKYLAKSLVSKRNLVKHLEGEQ
ncbi:glycosyl transferase family 2 [Pseudomonas fluorescens]|nr:glycosyl transferase family 2 [Pseudomonas fluorescens]